MTGNKYISHFLYPNYYTMGKIKNRAFDLSESMTEEEMQDFGIELNKAEHYSYYYDSLSMNPNY